MKKGKIELTEEEANILINLINIANKVEGLKNANDCLYFYKLITEAFKPEVETINK